ncbi:MAG: alpha/beta hydrolase [Elainellaceae cyanobacterium]
MSLPRFWNVSLAIACFILPSLATMRPKPAVGAEEIQVVVGGPLTLTLSVADLERFAATGEAAGDLALVTGFLDPETREGVRQQLARPIPLDLIAVNNLAYSPLGRDVIANVGKVIRIHPDVNGFYGLRGAAIGAAAAAGPDGWTVLDLLRQFPSQSIHVRLRDLLALRRTMAVYFGYNQAVVAAIQQQSAAEATAEVAPVDITALRLTGLSGVAPEDAPGEAALPDLSQFGPHAIAKRVITVENPALRQTNAGLTVNYDFSVDVYHPIGLDEPAPLLIISHGFGDVKDSFAFLGAHLASHGIVTLLPEHVGSDLGYRQEFLEGGLNTLLSPMEFLNRPQEISFLIDELERLTEGSPWASRLDLGRIGVMGDSLGGTTALSLAGAQINPSRLTEACEQDNVILNITLYLECRAQFLPAQDYRLADERIKAVVAMHPMGGYLYGPEGMAQVDIPLLMLSGSNDIVAPVVTEQVYPFIWSQASPKYLALMQVGTHFTSKPGRLGVEGIFQLLTGAHRDIGTRYAKTLITAFLQTHLSSGEPGAESPYLTASYARALSADEPLRLDLIRALTREQLEAAYGRTPPIPVNPSPATSPSPPTDEPVLAEIQRTGVLKVGFRKDAPPLGYLNPANEWDGYCGAMAIALRDYLTGLLAGPVGVEMVELTSTLENRFDLVRDGAVHLECGPNTIGAAVEGVTFSQAVIAAEAYAQLQRAVGVDGVQAPEQRLDCPFYGFILPDGDAAWKTTVDAFLASEAEDAIAADWFGAPSLDLSAAASCPGQN